LTLKEIMFIAAVTAIGFSAVRFVKLGLIVNHLIALGLPENIGEGDLFSSGATLYRQYKWTGINLFYNIVLSVIAASFLIMYHRNSSGSNSKLKSITNSILLLLAEPKTVQIWIIKAPAMLLVRLLKFFDKTILYVIYAFIYMLFFNLFISLIPSFSCKQLILDFSWMQLRPPGITMLLTAMAITYLLTYFKVEKYYFPQTTIRLVFPFPIDIDITVFKDVIQLFYFGLITAIYIKGDNSLPSFSKVVLAVSANMAAALGVVVLRFISIYLYIRPECLIYRRILWKSCLCPLPLIRDRTESFRMTKEMLIHSTITWMIPFCLLCFLGHMALLKFDLWFFTNIDSLKESLHEIVWAGPHQSHPGIFKLLFLMFLCNYVGQGKIPPSLALSLFIAIIIFFTGITIALILFAVEDKSKKCLNKIKLQEMLSKLLGDKQLFTLHEKRYFAKKILKKCSHKHPYIYDAGKSPLMTSTCDAILFIQKNNLDDRLLPDMVCWIKQCMSSNGGFAATPEIPPDLYHTYAALSMLHEVGQLEPSAKLMNNRWLKEQFREFMNCEEEQITDRDWLFYANNIVRSISLTASGERFSKDEAEWLSRKAYYRWQRNKQSPLYTRLFVIIIKNLDLFKTTYDTILEEWLLDHERKMSSLSPKAQLADIIEYITIISFMYPQSYLQRESIVQIRDNINKLYNQINIKVEAHL
jgi:hypothetical protein